MASWQRKLWQLCEAASLMYCTQSINTDRSQAAYCEMTQSQHSSVEHRSVEHDTINQLSALSSGLLWSPVFQYTIVPRPNCCLPSHGITVSTGMRDLFDAKRVQRVGGLLVYCWLHWLFTTDLLHINQLTCAA